MIGAQGVGDGWSGFIYVATFKDPVNGRSLISMNRCMVYEDHPAHCHYRDPPAASLNTQTHLTRECVWLANASDHSC